MSFNLSWLDKQEKEVGKKVFKIKKRRVLGIENP